jgi:predicted signal transduction protein with EAL and GGDEF domain
VRIGELQLRASASIGLTHANDQTHEAERLIRDSDAAMYAAKRNGRGGIKVFDPDLQAATDARRDMEQALNDALINQRLDVAYQPIVRLGPDDVVAYEALARWNQPGVGPVAPSDFIALAEDTGLIMPLGEWILEQACRRITQWTTTVHKPLVSVNISVKQFANGALQHSVQRILERTGADPTRLMLEITESVLISDIEDVVAQLRALTRLGVHIAVDDFGSGYSALSYLRQLPISHIKLDRGFLDQLEPTTPPATTLVNAVVHLAHALGHTVIAEGVETKQQRDVLCAYGCDWAQGFHFAPPLTQHDATTLAFSETPAPTLTT